MSPRAGIVIPVWNKVDVTLRCLEALVANTPDDLYEVIVVDNASTDETPALLAGLGGDVTVVTNSENVGYTLASNQGAAATDAEVVVFLNNDTEPQPGWLEALLECLDRERDTAIVGAKLVYPDGRLQEAGGLIFSDGTGWNFGKLGDPSMPIFNRECEVDYCSGAALAVRRDFLDVVGGGYDERYAPAYYEDADLCFAAREAGWKVRYVPSSVVVHHEGITAGTDEATGYKRYQAINRETFVDKWQHVLDRHDLPPVVSGIRPTTADRRLRVCGVARRALSTKVRPGPQRVLMVEPLLPLHDQSAGSMRTFRILQHLRSMGHDVTYIARNGAKQERYVADLEAMGITVHAGDRDRLLQLGVRADEHASLDLAGVLQHGRFDLAWLSFPQLALQYAPLIRALSPETRIWVDSVDVHHVREQRGADLAAAEKAPDAAVLQQRARDARAIEQLAYGLGDGMVAVTEHDAAVLRDLVPGAQTAVVPTIHPLSPAVAPVSERRGLLFVGNFGHPPNQDAMAWFCSQIMPRLRSKVSKTVCRVVGGSAPDDLQALMQRTKGVEYLGWVPEVAPYLDQSRVSIAPLRVGSGMKGKIGEALAAGLPVVTTTIGAEGMGLTDSVDVVIADRAGDFATAIAGLLRDDDAWQQRSEAGRALMGDRYSEASVVAALGQLLASPPCADPTAPEWRPRQRAPHAEIPARGGPAGVVVLGMHRSGTSSMAQLLAAVGFTPGEPDHLMSASASNPAGHHELNQIVDCNDKVLAQQHRYWHCPPTGPGAMAGRRFDPARTQLQSILRNLLPERGWLLKDPRLCVMWDLYRDVFATPPMGVVIARHPADVAISLQSRDAMPVDQGLMLWEFYNRSALRALASLDHRVVVDYDCLVGDPGAVTDHLRAAVSTAGFDDVFVETAVSPVDPSLNRSRASRGDVDLPPTVESLWEQIHGLARHGFRDDVVEAPSIALCAAIDARAARVEAHIDALRRGWEEPVAQAHRPLH